MANYESPQLQPSETGPIPTDVLEETYRSLKSDLVAFAARKGASDPEGVVQEAFMKASTTDCYTEQGKLSNWLYTIVRNLTINELRQRQRQAAIPASDDYTFQTLRDESAQDEFDQVEFNEIVDQLEAQLHETIGQERTEVIVMAASGIGQEEIAAILGISHGTVRSRLSRARSILRDRREEFESLLLGT